MWVCAGVVWAMIGDLAEDVVRACEEAGVVEFVVCAGARNAALVVALVDGGRTVRNFFDERSAGFYALGRAVASGLPVAVVTTSGTAVAELLPAVVEAHYRRVPLVLVTADRPGRFAGSGAPQAIEQVGIFANYVECCVDVEGGWRGGLVVGDRPVQVNVRCEERDGVGAVEVWGEAEVSVAKRTVVLLGELAEGERDEVERWVRGLGVTVWAEAISGLRERLGMRGGERALREGKFERVVRVGGVPSCRFWRDLEERGDVEVISVTRTGFSGLARASLVMGELPALVCSGADVGIGDVGGGDVEVLIEKYPGSEGAVVRSVSEAVPAGALVMLGNSLPIREWNAFATWEDKGLRCFANRGANGIDGLLSTWFGLSEGEDESWAVVGDLSALYDANAMWAGRGGRGKKRLVVINNGGGKIFSRVAALNGLDGEVRGVIENRHGLGFEAWAGQWGWGYARSLEEVAGERVVVELVPDAGETEAFWEALG